MQPLVPAPNAPAEHVYVEHEWYDGPRSGIADFRGVPHRFQSASDETDGGTYLLSPLDATTLALEIEQWRIFVAWNDLYEAGLTTVETHPGHGGLNARWDELEMLLSPKRTIDSLGARRARARFERHDHPKRYHSNGTDYSLAWEPLNE